MRVTFLTAKRNWIGPQTLLMVFCACFSLNAISADANGGGEELPGDEILENIRSTAEKFALATLDDRHLHNVVAKSANLDPRLRLRECSEPLEAFSSGNAGKPTHKTVGVRCAAPNPWTLYVPVTISATTDVVFTTRAIARSEMPMPVDLEVRRVGLDKLPPGYLSSMAELGQMELVRPLRSGSPLTLNALTRRDLVRQGQEVVIVAMASGLQVKMKGTALKNGSEGERILVKNSNSGRSVEATVLKDGSVKVDW